MNDVLFDVEKVSPQANPIACLEHNNHNLYGEVIQLIPHRQLCWFRPICLLVSDLAGENAGNLLEVFTEPNGQTLSEKPTPRYLPSTIISDYRKSLPGSHCLPQKSQLIDLQSGSDLLWPESLFRPALDTEAIGFLAQLNNPDHPSIDKVSSQKYFRAFIHQVWQAHQDQFKYDQP